MFLFLFSVLLLFRLRNNLNRVAHYVLRGAMMGILAAFILFGVNTMRENVSQPPIWDFLVFWLDGLVGLSGDNFYDPATYHQVELPISVSSEFRAEVLDVAFRYPPPTMFLFLPLGLFDIRTSILLWYIVQCLILLGSIILLRNTLFSRSVDDLLFVSVLVLIVYGTLSTLVVAQTNFMALISVLLLWRYRQSWKGGIWLAFGVFVKPFVAFLLLFHLLRRQWKVFLSTLAFLVLFSTLAVMAFGVSTFAAFLLESPYSRIPVFLYNELGFQSLAATIYRQDFAAFASTSSYIESPVFGYRRHHVLDNVSANLFC